MSRLRGCHFVLVEMGLGRVLCGGEGNSVLFFEKVCETEYLLCGIATCD